MTGLQSSLYTVAIALCVFSTGLLRDKAGPAGRSFTWFTAFLAVATLGFGFELLMIHPESPLKSLWLALRMAISLLIAPCLWLAVRESVEGIRPRLTQLGRGHWAPILAGFVLMIPLMGSAHFGTGYTRPPGPDRLLHSAIHETMLLCIGIFAVQVPYYLWQCRRMLRSARGSSTWLQIPLLVVLTTWVLGLLRTLHTIGHTPRELGVLFALADVGVAVGAIYLIVRRGPEPVAEVPPAITPIQPEVRVLPEPPALPESRWVLPAPPVVPRQPVVPETPVLPAPVVGPEAKYVRSSLDAATSVRIRRKLETALANPAVCRDSLLNLRSLSRVIGEKAHYVSQIINRDLNSNFYELVNRHRIAQAQQLLVERRDQTILEIALAVGFNSKSTFNTAFRRQTGMTPSEFRAGKTG